MTTEAQEIASQIALRKCSKEMGAGGEVSTYIYIYDFSEG